MNKIKSGTILNKILIGSIIAFLHGCFYSADEFIAPSHKTYLSFPLADSTYTLLEFVDDDSNIVISDDPNSIGLLHYVTSEIFETQYVEDNLKLDSLTEQISKSIGKIEAEVIPPIEAPINVENWISGVTSGTDQIIPETSSYTTSQFNSVNKFEVINFENGEIKITIVNYLPVPIEVRGFHLINTDDNSIFIVSEENEAIHVLANDSTSIIFDISNKTIRNRLLFAGTLFTEGSNGIVVSIPSVTGTWIRGQLQDHSIRYIRAKLPAQFPIVLDSTIVIDDSTKFSSMLFDSGTVDLVINNFMDLDVNLRLELQNLFLPNGSGYTQDIFLARNERERRISIPSLSNWRMESLNSGELTNAISVYGLFEIPATNDIREISSTDSISINFELENTVIKSIAGQVKPSTFKIDETSFGIDLGDLRDTFTFDSIRFADPYVSLKLKSSIGFGILSDAILTARNGSQSESIYFPIQLDPYGDDIFNLTEYGFTDLLNSFTNTFPDSFTVSGNTTVNPDYIIGSVSQTDSIGGSVDLIFPLDLGISGGSIIDTVDIDSIGISEDEINSIESFKLILDIENAIPFSLSMKGVVVDEDGNELISFPPPYNSNSEIFIEAPEVDQNGFVTSKARVLQSIEFNGADAKIFLRNPRLIIDLNFLTPPLNANLPVKFRSVDNIRMKMAGEVEYIINNPDGNN